MVLVQATCPKDRYIAGSLFGFLLRTSCQGSVMLIVPASDRPLEKSPQRVEGLVCVLVQVLGPSCCMALRTLNLGKYGTMAMQISGATIRTAVESKAKTMGPYMSPLILGQA